MYSNLYFKAVKNLLDRGIREYCEATGLTRDEVDALIAKHLKYMAEQYTKPQPNIDFTDPLCRLSYLFAYVCLDATVCERASYSEIGGLIQNKDELSICSIGGGPGTELLAVTQICLREAVAPTQINFTILDSVYEWNECFVQVASIAQEALNQLQGFNVSINPMFKKMDVTQPSSHTSLPGLFEQTDVFIFNHVFSEIQLHREKFQGALQEMVNRAHDGCAFIFIDRLESGKNSTFSQDHVEQLALRSGLRDIRPWKNDKYVVDDDEIVLGDYPKRFDRHPRLRYIIKDEYPTVFAFRARK